MSRLVPERPAGPAPKTYDCFGERDRLGRKDLPKSE